MKRHFSFSILAAAYIMIAGCGGEGSNGGGIDPDPTPDPTPEERTTFSNPIIRNDAPDPTILDNRERDGYFYIASTNANANGSTQVMPIYKSADLVNWEYVGSGFNIKPNFAPAGGDGGLWAPDLNYINGKYVVYFALGVWGNDEKSCCGVAVADKPEGPYTDAHLLLSYENCGIGNSIDPNYFEDSDGKKYLFWGSYGDRSGCWMTELSDDGLSIKGDPQTDKIQVGSNSMEGTYIHKRGDWYYMFTSSGSCCNYGTNNNTYHLQVGRSHSVFGPYKGKDDKQMVEVGFDYENTILSSTSDLTFIGCGHNAEIVTDDAGQDWMVYHCYIKDNNYKTRSNFIQQVYWSDDGWPYFESGHPIRTLDKPTFK